MSKVTETESVAPAQAAGIGPNLQAAINAALDPINEDAQYKLETLIVPTYKPTTGQVIRDYRVTFIRV